MIKNLLVSILLFFCFTAFAQDNISVISWNIRDFGKTKSSGELEQIAEIVRDADILAIQEVVSGYGGAQAVAKLADILNRKGSKWDYVISNPTCSTKYVTERYAFIWKTSRFNIKQRGKLISELDSLVDREPFLMDFYLEGKAFTLIDFHSRPHDKNPEAEIAAITNYLIEDLRGIPVLLVGDFNVNEQEPIFDALKHKGFTAAIFNQKTTLKYVCEGNDYLNYAIDNIFYSKGIIKTESNAIDFVRLCENLEAARTLSDHLPVFMEFTME
tara:strand:+ start:3675 stop:4487 length:813 start_codon:yes stop_codon:yes gene_type:complete